MRPGVGAGIFDPADNTTRIVAALLFLGNTMAKAA